MSINLKSSNLEYYFKNFKLRVVTHTQTHTHTHTRTHTHAHKHTTHTHTHTHCPDGQNERIAPYWKAGNQLTRDH